MKKFAGCLGVLSIVAMAGYWLLYGDTPMIAPDSLGYLDFSPSRTPGYPIFLWLCHAISGAYTAVPIVQLVLLFISMAYLSLSFYGLSRSVCFSLGLWLLLAGNIEVIKYAFLLLTESLTVTLLLFSLGILCRFVATQRICHLVSLSILLGLAILVRPAAYGWVLGLLLAGIGLKVFAKISYWRGGGALLMPLIGAVLVGSAFNYYYHGFFKTQSFLGETLIGKVGALAERDIPSHTPEVMVMLSDYSGPVQALLKSAPNQRIEYLLSTVYADQYRYSPFARRLAAKMLNGSPEAEAGEILDKKRTQLAMEIIRARPLAYLHNCLINYLALWQVWDFATPIEVKALSRFLSRETPLPHAVKYPDYPRQAAYKKGSWMAAPLRVGLLWVLCASFWALFTFLVRVARHKTIAKPLYLAAVSAGFVQGAYLSTALVQSGIPRFFLVMWPAIVLIGIASLWHLNNQSIREKKKHA